MLPDAQAALLSAYAQGWGDPLRLHRPGRLAALALAEARTRVAAAVGARPDEVVFTPSLAHSAHAAVAGLARGRRRTGDIVVTTAVDHSSVLAAARTFGVHREVPVDHRGRVDLDRWTTEVSAPGVAAATLQVANHEVGTLQPYAEAIASAQAGRGARRPRRDDRPHPAGPEPGAGAGRSCSDGPAPSGGPTGVGFLVIRRGTRWRAPYPTDDYQDGRWPGPPDVAAVHAAAVALDSGLGLGRTVGEHQHRLVDRLRTEIAARVPDVEVAGDPVRPGPAPAHLLCALRRRRSPDGRAGPGRLRRGQRIGLQRPAASSPPTSWPRWGR